MKLITNPEGGLFVEGPYDREKKVTFMLTNEYHKNQAFNFKTTLPASIRVSPSRGFIKVH